MALIVNRKKVMIHQKVSRRRKIDLCNLVKFRYDTVNDFCRVLVQILKFNWSVHDENILLKRFNSRETVIIMSFKQKVSCAFSLVEVEVGSVEFDCISTAINVSFII